MQTVVADTNDVFNPQYVHTVDNICVHTTTYACTYGRMATNAYKCLQRELTK